VEICNGIDDMKKILMIACAAAALSGCASGYGGYGFGGGAYDAYYDDSYGAIYDGYWRGDGFYYRTGPHDHYVRDRGGHFRRDAATGYHNVHGQRPGMFHHGDGSHRDH
jgi:hypothetical protein